MFSNDEWRYISSLKSLTRDEYGRMWTASHRLNGFLAHLPWWAKDRRLDETCLLYQVDSKGELYILCILHVWRIQTTKTDMVIAYKTDARHACLEQYRVRKERWGHVGLMAISPFGGAPAAPRSTVSTLQNRGQNAVPNRSCVSPTVSVWPWCSSCMHTQYTEEVTG